MKASAPIRDTIDALRDMEDDYHGGYDLNKLADNLEICYEAVYEDIYVQCCDLIRPLVDEDKFPGSVVETLEKLIEYYHMYQGLSK